MSRWSDVLVVGGGVIGGALGGHAQADRPGRGVVIIGRQRGTAGGDCYRRIEHITITRDR